MIFKLLAIKKRFIFVSNNCRNAGKNIEISFCFMSKSNVTITANADNVAVININGKLYSWDEYEFVYELNKLTAQGVQDVEVYINSGGGSVFVANEIVNHIKKFKGTITGYGGAMVASAATYIASHCATFTMSNNGQFMIHKPHAQFTGNEDEIKSQLQLLTNLTNDYVKVYSQKTGKSEEQIRQMMQNDNWMSATTAKAEGFVDAVEGEARIDAATVETLKVYGCPTLPAITASDIGEKQETISEMKIDFKALNLADTATEEEVNAAIKALASKANEAEQEKQNAIHAKAEALVDGAIAAKKITADQKKTFLNLAKADYDNTKTALDKMQAVQPLSQQLEGDTNEPQAEDRSTWDWDTYMAKDKEALLAMADNEPKKYEALVKAKIAKK